MAQSEQRRGIPTSLSIEEFDEFVCPFLSEGRRGPKSKVTLHAVFNYILQALYLGCPWKSLPIAKDEDGRPELHYSRVYRWFRRWLADGCLQVVAGFRPADLGVARWDAEAREE